MGARRAAAARAVSIDRARVTPRRIAVIQRFLPSRSRGGVGHFTHGLAEALVRRGHRVTVFSQDRAPDGATYDVHMVGATPTARPGRLAPLAFPFEVAKC